MNLYSIKDKLVGFGGPVAFKDDKIAIRWFESYCKSMKESEYTDPKYFELYHIGSMDSENGSVTGKSVNELELIREGEAFNE